MLVRHSRVINPLDCFECERINDEVDHLRLEVLAKVSYVGLKAELHALENILGNSFEQLGRIAEPDFELRGSLKICQFNLKDLKHDLIFRNIE